MEIEGMITDSSVSKSEKFTLSYRNNSILCRLLILVDNCCFKTVLGETFFYIFRNRTQNHDN